jgi:SOS-response transcriptional repressor LexA
MIDHRFADVLREAMSRAGLRPSQLAKRLRMSRATVYKWLSGETLPAQRAMMELETILGIPSYPVSNVLRPTSVSRWKVPLVEASIADSSLGSIAVEDANLKIPKSWIDIDFPVSDGAVAIVIKDDSMEPEYFDGEIVVVDPGVTPQNGDCIIAEIADSKTGEHHWLFKQYRSRGRHDGKHIFDLVPINPRYKTVTIGLDLPGHVVGTTVEHRRRVARLRSESKNPFKGDN